MRATQPFLVWLLWSLLCLGTPLRAQTAALSGTWALQLGKRTLMVLTLAPSSDKGLAYGGTLSRPRNFTSSDGESFSHIQSGTITEPIIQSGWRGKAIFLQLQNPTDPADKDAYLFDLTDRTHAELRIADFPQMALHLVRVDGTPAVAADWDPTKTYSPDDDLPSNPEMKRIFDEDQMVRQPGHPIDWKQVTPADAQRRAATMKLLNGGALHTGDDYIWASFIFQHGDTPDDFLLAHTLAMIAVKKGKGDALWMGAATLDRYLQSMHHPQIYGTQFNTPEGAPATQEPYNRALISDALRKQLGVPALQAQAKQREQYDKERGLLK